MEEKNYNYGVRVGGVGNIIDVSNPDDTGAQGWRYDRDNHTILIFTPSDYTLMGSTEENKVLVQPESASKLSFNLILMGVSIHKQYNDYSSGPAIAVRGGAFCRILVYQNNYVSGGSNAAAVNVTAGSSLELDALLPDRYSCLQAYGGRYAAAIGANNGEAYGNITIKNVTLQLGCNGWNGNGIGYGEYVNYYQSSGKIKFLGGSTSIHSTYTFDGIACSDLEISAGKLDIATRGAGIALYGTNRQECRVRICGDAEVTVRGYAYSPGIDCFVPNGKGYVVIDGGVVTAYGGYGAAGIGTGYYQGWSDSLIEINGGVVSAYSGSYGAGIGTGRGYSSGLDIEINGGIICAHGLLGGAGIGGGYGGKVKSIFISSKAKVIAESHDEEVYDIGGITTDMKNYTGLYSGVYSGKLSGLYQGRLSGLFKGRLGREYTNKVNCKLRGFYTGKAAGIYSGLFVGRFSGGIRPSLYSGLFTGRTGKKFVSKH